MHASGWIDLIRTIPDEIYPSLTVMMQNGAEINVQNIVRLEEQFIVCRGRTAGSTDGGLVFFMPYDQIASISVNRPTKPEVVNTWFRNQPFYSLEEEVLSTVSPVGEQPAMEPAAPVPAAPAAASPGLMPAPGPLAPKPAPAPASPPVATVAARPAPGPQPATTPMTMGNMALPAKAAMIERLRKRQPPGGPAPVNPSDDK